MVLFDFLSVCKAEFYRYEQPNRINKALRIQARYREPRGKKGQATELITIYIPPDKQISDVTSQLRDEYGQAANIKSKSTRTNVQSALSSIMSRLKYYRFPPSKGLVIFTGTISLGGDKTTMETLVVEPIEPIKSYQYRCDSTFNLEPLKEMLKEKDVFGLVVVDRNEATVGILDGKRIKPIKHLTSGVPGKHTKGGQSQRRFERLRLIAIHEFYKRIGEAANNEFLQHPELKGVLIGGPSPTKEEFVDGEYLHHELQQRILGAFDASYTDEFGLSELVENGAEVLQELDLMREKNAVERFLKELVHDSNKATYGEKQVRKALELGAVDTLLLSEALRIQRVTNRCPLCGFTLEETIRAIKGAGVCPKCEGSMERVDEEDVVDELIRRAGDTSTAVEFISTDFDEGEQLMRAFGGIAAILRFAIDEH